MISKAELQAEIAFLESQSASWQNCERLAALYTIKNELFGKTEHVGKTEQLEQRTALPVGQAESYVDYQSGTEFSQVVNGMEASKAWAVMDELMDGTLRIINPRLYTGVLAELQK